MASNSPQSDRRPSRIRQFAEVGLIFVLFFLSAGGLPPDVNEAHYLAKAKHFWNPSWCAGDAFLESADAHQAFYWTLGWTTIWLPLPAVAWLGRTICWGLLAWSWFRFSWTLVPRPLVAAASAALLVTLVHWGQMAGEWLVGGVEAKCIAYALVLFALEAMLRDRWTRCWLLIGAATGMHVLVGGWAGIAMVGVWVTAGDKRPPLGRTLVGWLGALVLCLPGLVPALLLNRGVDAQSSLEAGRIYVFERLSHHLVLHRFVPAAIGRHVLLIAAWLACWLLTRRGEPSATAPLTNRGHRFVAGAVAIAAVGGILDVVSLFSTQWAAPLLRFYWFRLSDVMVPLGVVIGLIALIERWRLTRPRWAVGLTLLLLTVAATHYAWVIAARRVDFRPPAVAQSRPVKPWWDSRSLRRAARARYEYEEWVRVCRWINRNTPETARFLTPRKQQTFHWYAGRADVAAWKNVPQDARGLLEWWQRVNEVYPRPPEGGLSALGEQRLVELAHRYQASHVLIDRTLSPRRLKLLRIYPRMLSRQPTFEVYEVPPQDAGSRQPGTEAAP